MVVGFWLWGLPCQHVRDVAEPVRVLKVVDLFESQLLFDLLEDTLEIGDHCLLEPSHSRLV